MYLFYRHSDSEYLQTLNTHICRENLDSQLLGPSLHKPMQQSTPLQLCWTRAENNPSPSPRTGLSDACKRESCLNCDLHRIQRKKKLVSSDIYASFLPLQNKAIYWLSSILLILESRDTSLSLGFLLNLSFLSLFSSYSLGMLIVVCIVILKKVDIHISILLDMFLEADHLDKDTEKNISILQDNGNDFHKYFIYFGVIFIYQLIFKIMQRL